MINLMQQAHNKLTVKTILSVLKSELVYCLFSVRLLLYHLRRNDMELLKYFGGVYFGEVLFLIISLQHTANFLVLSLTVIMNKCIRIEVTYYE